MLPVNEGVLESRVCEDTSECSVSHSLCVCNCVMQYAQNSKCQTNIARELYWKKISLLCTEGCMNELINK